jgi:hypothetical protein
MKKLFSTCLFILYFTIITTAQPKHEIQIMNLPPNWCEQLNTINLGKYYDYILKDNPKEQILALQSWGDRKIGINPPFQQFLYLVIDNQALFLKFINLKNKGVHAILTYTYGVYKVILDFDGIKVTQSGNGEGGIFHLYYNNVLIKKYNFWVSL